jgi:thioredoxin 1
MEQGWMSLKNKVAQGMLGLMFAGGITLQANSSLVKEPSTMEALREWTKEAEAQKKLIVLYFSANQCPPCQVFSPIIEELALEFKEKICFFKILAENEKMHEFITVCGVAKLPWLSIIKAGENIASLVGARSKKQFRAELLNYMTMEVEKE